MRYLQLNLTNFSTILTHSALLLLCPPAQPILTSAIQTPLRLISCTLSNCTSTSITDVCLRTQRPEPSSRIRLSKGSHRVHRNERGKEKRGRGRRRGRGRTTTVIPLSFHRSNKRPRCKLGIGQKHLQKAKSPYTGDLTAASTAPSLCTASI